MKEEWNGFKDGIWAEEVNVSDFILKNYQKYDEDESFLNGTTEKTNRVLARVNDLLKEELKKHVLDIDVDHMSGINAFNPGYICDDDDVIVE